MDVAELDSCISETIDLQYKATAEKTIFSIGTRGYYENPTTDILAFFLDSNEDHKLGDTVVRSLFNAVIDNASDSTLSHLTDFQLIAPPIRELLTKDRKRIDLVLIGRDWAMIIENKIFHEKNNPFDEYRLHIEEQSKLSGDIPLQGKQPIFIVLSPDGFSPNEWIGIPYKDLIKHIKSAIAFQFVNQPLNKWLLLLREFIVHLESLMTDAKIPEKTVDYVLNNLEKLNQITKIKNGVIDSVRVKISADIKQEWPDLDVSTESHTWEDYPAIRFYLSHLKRKYETVLYLNSAQNSGFTINSYIYEIRDKGDRGKLECLLKETALVDIWEESNGRILAYRTRIHSKDVHEMSKQIIRSLKLLNNFDQIRNN